MVTNVGLTEFLKLSRPSTTTYCMITVSLDVLMLARNDAIPVLIILYYPIFHDQY